MKAVWISEVVLLLSVVELEVATSAYDSSCPKRDLTVTVDDILRLYIDGIEITGLPNVNIAYEPDVVALPCTTRLIAIHGRNGPGSAGILASTGDYYVLTNSSWKCSNVSHSGWEAIDFDDSSWMSAVVYGHNGEGAYLRVPGISTNAEWIWTRQQETDKQAYCRKRTGFDECHFGQPINECDPSIGRCISLSTGYNCSCNPGYQNDGQHKCKDVDECLLGPPENMCNSGSGNCTNTPGSYKCRCHQGFTNAGDQRCEDVDECLLGPPENKCNSSSGNCTNTPGSYKCRCYQGFKNAGDQRCEGLSNNSALPAAATDVVLILGVLLGVSFLIIVALIVALSIVCSRTSTSKDPDCMAEEVETHKDAAPTVDSNATYEDLEMSDVNGCNKYESIRKGSHI